MKTPKHTFPIESAPAAPQLKQTFALENVTQLREAIDEVVYGETDEPSADDPTRVHTVAGLTTLGQMGLLTEMDLDEAKEGYL